MAQYRSLLDTVHAGDCLTVMADWPAALADLCFVALPASGCWQWNQAAADRMDRIQRQPKRVGHDTVLGLHIILGDVGAMAYLSYVAERLPLLMRLLKPAGSLCLIADDRIGHYAKVLVDGFFGKRMRDEIIWRGALPAANQAGTSETPRSTVAWYSRRSDGMPRIPAWTAQTWDSLIERLLVAATRPGDVVLDPFSAHAADIARRMRRHAISFENA